MTRYTKRNPPPGRRRGALVAAADRRDDLPALAYDHEIDGTHYEFRGRVGFIPDAGPGRPCPCGRPVFRFYLCASCGEIVFQFTGPLVVVPPRASPYRNRYANRTWTTPDEQRLSVED